MAVDQAPDREASGAVAVLDRARGPFWNGRGAFQDRVQVAGRRYEHFEPVVEPREHEARVHGPPRFDGGLETSQQAGAVRRQDVRVIQVEDDGERAFDRGAGRGFAADGRAFLVAAASRFLHVDRRLVEVRDPDRLAVHVQLEVLSCQVLDRTALLVRDHDVDLDDLHVDRVDERLIRLGPECGRAGKAQQQGQRRNGSAIVVSECHSGAWSDSGFSLLWCEALRLWGESFAQLKVAVNGFTSATPQPRKSRVFRVARGS